METEADVVAERGAGRRRAEPRSRAGRGPDGARLGSASIIPRYLKGARVGVNIPRPCLDRRADREKEKSPFEM